MTNTPPTEIKSKNQTKVLAIASAGGHWTQLLRLKPAFDEFQLIFVTTKESFASTVEGHEFFVVPEANRWQKFKLIKLFFCVVKTVLKTRPNVVVSTGAAPGLMGIIAGKLIGGKTIWIDSIANVEKLSLSGKIAVFFADRVYTQWSHLATTNVMFKGNVLS